MSPNPINDRFERMAQSIAERVARLVIDSIDLNAIMERVDVDRLVSRVNADAIVDRVDVEKIVERVDVEKILERVDVNALVERVDIRRIVDQLDIESLVAQTELGSIIARSTSGVAAEVLDVIRAQGVGLDDFFARWTNRILRRPPNSLPLGPPSLVSPAPLASATPLDGSTAGRGQ
ncbi:MAG TPA: hypothetical protein VG014_08480 [Acidimicrobiales bacterium]|nr:hypothetical protein [Acidimicrobiales bacterium]